MHTWSRAAMTFCIYLEYLFISHTLFKCSKKDPVPFRIKMFTLVRNFYSLVNEPYYLPIKSTHARKPYAWLMHFTQFSWCVEVKTETYGNFHHFGRCKNHCDVYACYAFVSIEIFSSLWPGQSYADSLVSIRFIAKCLIEFDSNLIQSILCWIDQ